MRSRLPLIGLMVVAGCIHYRSDPQPDATPSRAVANFAARRLDEPELTSYIAGALGQSSSTTWDEDRIALAALYFRGDIALERAIVDEARAGELTAGAWPPFTVDGSLSRTARPLDNTGSRWSQSISAALTLELGGKRGARRARASAETLAARLRLEAAAWRVATEARAAVVNAVAADDALADADAEAAAQRVLTQLLRDRYAEGQLPLAEVARSETDDRGATVAAVEAKRARIDARIALAHAIGVGFLRVDTLPLRITSVSSCAKLDSLGARSVIAAVRDSLATMALQTRADIGAEVADYTAADADVRLEVAQQYPDLTLGPGLFWDHGVPGWIVNVGLPSLIGNRNKGPIAGSEARRAEQAARVRLLQDSVLGDIDGAVASCGGVRGLVSTADSLIDAAQHAVDLADSAYQRGETGHTELAIAHLALVRAAHTRRQATARHEAAGAALDRATGRWIGLTRRGPWPDGPTGTGSPH
jgi:outer membrane protein, heavy metal efflux system